MSEIREHARAVGAEERIDDTLLDTQELLRELLEVRRRMTARAQVVFPRRVSKLPPRPAS